jgi:hypothetical protein
MAVYNGEAHVREAIDSILRQSYEHLEFLIIDDASTDGTPAALDVLSDPRVRILRNSENLGLAASLNRGIEAASGEFIARQDADDVSEPDRLSRQVAYLDSHPDVALLGTAHTVIDAEGRVLDRVDAHCQRITILWWMLFFCPFIHSAVMFRRVPVIDAVGAYDPTYRYSVDYEYWTRIARRFGVANLPQPLVRLRVHDASMTATYGDHTREGHRLRVQTVARLLEERPRGMEPNEIHQLLSALLLGPRGEYDVDSLLGAIGIVFELQRAFARDWHLTPDQSRAHRAEVRRHISDALLSLARADPQRTATGRQESRRFLAHAVRTNPSLLLEPRKALGVVALLGAPLAAIAAEWRRS